MTEVDNAEASVSEVMLIVQVRVVLLAFRILFFPAVIFLFDRLLVVHVSMNKKTNFI